MYFVYPDVLSSVGETSYGIGVESMESDEAFAIYLFVSEVQILLFSS